MSTARDDRAFWAHQVHTHLLNTLGAAIAQSQVCEAAVREALPSSVDEVRRLREMLRALEATARTMADAAVASGDLLREVRARMRALAAAHPGLTVRLRGRGRPRVGDRAAAAAVIVLTEALRNSVQHGAPSAIDVGLRVGRRWLRLDVRDDGRGFDPRIAATAPAARPRLGLAIMRQWARALGGTLAVRSAPGRGTEVILRLPVHDRRVPAGGRTVSPSGGRSGSPSAVRGRPQ